jgi:predicted dinucleotide-binding enzyme
LKRGRAADQAGRIALPVSGDDASAKAVVIRLMDEIGFEGIDAGTLAESWKQQPGSPVYATDLDADGVRRALGEARKERPAEFRASAAATPAG